MYANITFFFSFQYSVTYVDFVSVRLTHAAICSEVTSPIVWVSIITATQTCRFALETVSVSQRINMQPCGKQTEFTANRLSPSGPLHPGQMIWQKYEN